MINLCAIVKGAATIAAETISAIKQFIDVWAFDNVDAYWLDTTTKPKPTEPLRIPLDWDETSNMFTARTAPDVDELAYSGECQCTRCTLRTMRETFLNSPAPPSGSGMPGDRPDAAVPRRQPAASGHPNIDKCALAEAATTINRWLADDLQPIHPYDRPYWRAIADCLADAADTT